MSRLLLTLCLSAASGLALAQSMPDPADAFMKQFDSNQDGQVTFEEFRDLQIQSMEQQFQFIDKNRDGSIDRAEMDAFTASMRERMQQMQQQR